MTDVQQESTDPEELKRQEWQDAFKLMAKKSGLLAPMELCVLLRSLGQDPTDEELDEYIEEYRVYAKGGFEYEDFLSIMAKREADHQARQKLSEALSLFDKDGNGFINVEELKQQMMEEGEKYTEEEFTEFVSEITITPDGMIDYREFVNVLLKK
uniref:Calmodulin n=1 Tax=Chromera velia CCMP2878 TaxID=1169474 RepID=A0A0G4G9K8_9ALVE|eukprot:Cvel_20862.t1-p1 / transcript=Cvel_20862.t1 / gene=Cvel_20862 / organism=Chromera_velia_CCMP2878 / gene_product=Calmodulin, putative / transcript_product=Calmodulin, putative / location=Cvel_scaffold1911:25262-29037(+) / protein_length=154 / sequence_SO=supercontig / SO=protein_coding / is_pseudo=false